MVSLRRRRLLGLSPGPAPILDPLFWYSDNASAPEVATQDNEETGPVIVRPVLSLDDEEPTKVYAKVAPGSSNGFGLSPSKELQNQHLSGGHIKRRKRHRRKHIPNQEPCVMRGVYFKNMKWQAAIKVEKKQIHLGTVATQEAAAHLYDRAAFMCGREPNFVLPEEEKKELTQYNWEDFLAMTRSSINNKKHRLSNVISPGKSFEPPQQSSDLDGEQETNSLSASEDAEPETPTS